MFNNFNIIQSNNYKQVEINRDVINELLKHKNIKSVVAELVSYFREQQLDFPFKLFTCDKIEISNEYLIKKITSHKYVNKSLYLVDMKPCVEHLTERLRLQIVQDDNLFTLYSKHRWMCKSNKTLFDKWHSDDMFLRDLLEICIINYNSITPSYLNQIIYSKYQITDNVYNIYSLLGYNLSVFDLMMNYGENLLISVNSCKEYVGITHQPNMYNNILELNNSTEIKLIEGYPDSTHYDAKEYFDVVFVGSTYQNYRNSFHKKDWLVKHVLKIINRGWYSLKQNGYLIVRGKLMNKMNNYIQCKFYNSYLKYIIDDIYIWTKGDYHDCKLRRKMHNHFNDDVYEKIMMNEDVW